MKKSKYCLILIDKLRPVIGGMKKGKKTNSMKPLDLWQFFWIIFEP